MMRYVPNDKYTIAWFKLAECVAKGEKEKAFGVYRLLMHSFEDQAYAYQLEGDLLSAFQDQRAIDKYAHAANLYSQNNRFKEAAALYRDLIFLVPDEQRYVLRLVDVYKKHKNHDILVIKLSKLADDLLEHSRPRHAILIAAELQELSRYAQAVDLYTRAIIQLSRLQDDVTSLEEITAKAIACISEHSGSHQLQSLLSTIEQTSSAWHRYICKLL